MRKTLRTLGLCALAALAIVSCKKNDEQAATMSFEATINQPTSGTRTGINEINGDKYMTWNNGDVIKVFAADGSASADFTTTDEGDTVANFTGEIIGAESYRAFYPAANVNAEAGSTTVKLTLSANQTYKNGSFSTNTYPLAAKSDVSDKTRFEFLSPCGLLAIPVKGTGTLGSIELTGKNGEKLAGTYTYNMADMSYQFNGTVATVTLTCEGGLELTNTPATMYFVLPAGALSGGFSILLKDTEGNSNTLPADHVVTNKPQTIVSQSITTMSEPVTVSGMEVHTSECPPSEIGSTSIEMTGFYGEVSPGMTVTEVGFYYRKATEPESANVKVKAKLANKLANNSFFYTLVGLESGVEYTYKSYVVVSGDQGGTESTGAEQTVTTNTPVSAEVPTLTTADVTVSGTEATVGGTITNVGYGTIVAGGCGIRYKSGTDDWTYVALTPENNAFSTTLTGLTENTTYTVQAYATTNEAGTGYGSEVTFTTPGAFTAPTVTTGTAEATSATTATGHVTLTNAGLGTVIQIGLCWGTTENPTVDTTANNFAAATGQTVNTEYEVAIANLESATEYHVRGYAKVGDDYYYAESSVNFTTPAAFTAPTVTTGAAAATSANEATGHVTLTNAGSGTVSQIGLCWSTTENPTVNATANNFAAATGQTVNTEYEVAIANLEPATQYYVCGYAKVGGNYYYAESSVTFTTELPGVESFTVDFENGLPEGWTTKDADGDGHNWVLDTETESAYGYNQSNTGLDGSHEILSASYHGTEGALTPDNYLVSPKVTLRSGSTFSFWASAQDAGYPADHFGVFVSDNGTDGWTMVQEWTMTAKGASGNRGAGRDGNTRYQGNWYQYTVDLSTYAGQKYIAIRHFNCSDNFFLKVDNIRLGDPKPGTSFSQNFNNSVLPEGWTTIDADGDGYTWVLTNQMAAYGYSSPNHGHGGTVGMTSGSYHATVGALTPDNYLVTPKVNLVQGSTFSFWACAEDADYPAEHFGVYVSDNGTSGWTMVQEWTMTAKGASGNKGNGRDGNTRDIGNWYQYTVDLSAYAGEKYIAIRHFNCSDEFFLEVDDILLTVNR